MAASKIEWTQATWNPIVGCSLQSPGCKLCYAMSMAARLEAISLAHEAKHGDPGPHAHYRRTTTKVKGKAVWTGNINVAPDVIFLMPLCKKKPTMFFVNSMSDLFHPDVPDDVIDRVFAVMALSPQHVFQILTKRPDRMRAYVTELKSMDSDDRDLRLEGPAFEATKSPCVIGALEELEWPLPNVWLGTSVEDQRRAEERIPDLLATPSAVRWLSCEPLLGPVWPWHELILARANAILGQAPDGPVEGIDWIVVGGESGRGSRPMHPDWARDLRWQCDTAGVPFFFKQHGDWVSVSMVEGAGRHHRFPDGATVRRVGKKAAGRLLDGVLHHQMPEVLHV